MKNAQLEECLWRCLEAVQREPESAAAQNELGISYARLGRVHEAIACFRQTIRLEPDRHQALNNLGTLLLGTGQIAEAIDALRAAGGLNPESPEICNNLANALAAAGQLDQAVESSRRSIELQPLNREAHNALGNALKDQGLIDEAMDFYARGLELRPDLATVHSNLLYTAHFHPNQNPQVLLDMHRVWNARHAGPLKHLIRPHTRGVKRRLRVGYVSPDFREHPVGRFILPLLESHDRERFEVFCYSQVAVDDAMSQRLRLHADHWRNIIALSDDELAEQIRADGIDILVDLTMHMRGNRLLAFARKPAPVQVTYLAYCSTTGMDAIDYRLTDPYLDPPGMDAFYSERSVRLPETYWCYRPADDACDVGPLPARVKGAITFGCLNNFCKVTEPTLDAWCALLVAAPKSRLILHAGLGSHRQRVIDRFARVRVDPQRIRFVGRLSLSEYFALHGEIDLAMDPFPCTGGTTTCDALWMGVPVVSLAGKTAVSRGGLSILSNLALDELVADTPEKYVRIAAALASDLNRLESLRGGLRQRMRSSPLMDEKRFARHVEEAYKWMWREKRPGPEGPA